MDHGLEVVTLPRELSIGDSQHKWGREPFHFGPNAMRWVSGQILYKLNRFTQEREVYQSVTTDGEPRKMTAIDLPEQ